uniref:Hemolysin XhlA n=1 Tax=Siphoviridae sp. ctDmR33 TaxID=2825389 RepID=A0A8S5UX35_9CAUD|nr:MAG TPA: hemolysin XhlA [Siphoviridae sp. ctDmR33]
MTHEELIAWAHDNEQRSKSNQHRIEQLEERQENLDKLVSSVAVIAEKQNRMEADVGDIKRDVKALTEKPGKRWDGVVDKIISILVAAIAGYALARIGLG